MTCLKSHQWEAEPSAVPCLLILSPGRRWFLSPEGPPIAVAPSLNSRSLVTLSI